MKYHTWPASKRRDYVFFPTFRFRPFTSNYIFSSFIITLHTLDSMP